MLKRFTALVMVLLLLPVFSLAQVYINEETPEDWQQRDLMRIVTMRTIRCDCFLVMAGGKTMLIDGAVPNWYNRLEATLLHWGIDHFDVVINTHPHDDHAGGLIPMINRGNITVDELVTPFGPEFNDKDNYNGRLHKAAAAAGVKVTIVEDGDSFEFGPVHVDCWTWKDAPTINERSLVNKLTFGEATVLTTGDISGTAQRKLLQRVGAETLRSDLFKAPHHGINIDREFFFSVIKEFLYVTTASYVRQTPARIAEQIGVPCMYTDDGTVIMETDGTDWYIRQWNTSLEQQAVMERPW